MGFWDAVKVDMTNEFFKFEAPGDVISGTVKDLELKTWPEGNQSINVTFEESGTPRLGASNIMLKNALFRAQPNAGDWISVEYTRDTVNGSRRMKRFKFAIKRADGTSMEFDA